MRTFWVLIGARLTTSSPPTYFFPTINTAILWFSSISIIPINQSTTDATHRCLTNCLSTIYTKVGFNTDKFLPTSSTSSSFPRDFFSTIYTTIFGFSSYFIIMTNHFLGMGLPPFQSSLGLIGILHMTIPTPSFARNLFFHNLHNNLPFLSPFMLKQKPIVYRSACCRLRATVFR